MVKGVFECQCSSQKIFLGLMVSLNGSFESARFNNFYYKNKLSQSKCCLQTDLPLQKEEINKSLKSARLVQERKFSLNLILKNQSHHLRQRYIMLKKLFKFY